MEETVSIRESVLHIDEFTSQSGPSSVTQPTSSSSSVRFARPGSFNPLPERCFMISTRNRRLFLSLSLTLSITLFLCCFPVPRTANRRPRRNTIPLALVCFPQRESLHLSPSRIDEFIAGTARSIVTKIVYDIDSSFYVNPVSERFCLTRFAHQNETLDSIYVVVA